ncbi:competence protein ComFB [Desulfobacteraceae bacterium SEEP-SAG9]|nr:competence protein ComFB [Desulfobacteraceae bacterium SEEP-SAG9]
MDNRSDFEVLGVDLSRIRNKNEMRVVVFMKKFLAEIKDWEPDTIDIQDIYALALNKLPARYIQKGTIVLIELVTNTEVELSVKRAIQTVREKPNH